MENGSNYLKKYLESRKENAELKKTITSLTNSLSMERNNYRQLKIKFENYKKEEEKRIAELVDKAVTKAVADVKKIYEEEINKLNNEISKLQSRLNIDSTNSNIPTTKNKIGKRVIQNNREKSDKNIGGQLNHKAHKLNYFKEEEITETVEHKLERCPDCGGELNTVNTVISDIIDVKVTVTKTRNLINNYKCKNCNKAVTANSQLPRGVSYGENLNAISLNLLDGCNVSYSKVEKYIIGLTNGEAKMSQGYFAKLRTRAAKKLEPFIKELKEKILTLPNVHWDDTTIKLGLDANSDTVDNEEIKNEESKNKESKKPKKTKEGIIRFYGDDDYALIIAHKDKSKEGVNEDGILPNLPSTCTCMHDHVLLNYNDSYSFKNAECNTHILRYLKGVKENIVEHTWQDKMSDLLKELRAEKEKNIENKIYEFNEEYIKEAYQKYKNIIELGYKENSELVDYHYYKKDELNLISRLDKFIDNHLMFIKDFSVNFSNNTAERGIRQVKRKVCVSGLFKNLSRAEEYATILSYTETCYRHGVNRMDALRRLFANNPYTISELKDIKDAENKKDI